jgi:hypothetical protein
MEAWTCSFLRRRIGGICFGGYLMLTRMLSTRPISEDTLPTGKICKSWGLKPSINQACYVGTRLYSNAAMEERSERCC